MARARRTALPDGIFHVTARGVDGTPIVRDDVDRVVFVRILAATAERYEWHVRAFCLMGNHFHLVVETSRAALSAGVQFLNGRHAQRFNRRHGRAGHLFGARFATRVIDDERRLENTIAYVLANPVRAGLCSEPAEWPWGAASPVNRTSVRPTSRLH